METKCHQAVDKTGLPLATVLLGTNVPGSQKLTAVIDAIPFVRGKRDRPCYRPEKMHENKAYDDETLRRTSRSTESSLG